MQTLLFFILFVNQYCVPLRLKPFTGFAPVILSNDTGPQPTVRPAPFGADNRIRTGDLILTMDALYLLSYIGIKKCGTPVNQ